MKYLMKILKRIVDILFIVFLIVFCLFLIPVCIQKFTSNDSIISVNGYYIFEVATGSMVPELEIGDYILVHKESDYSIGDVITYENNGSYITHRIIKQEDDTIITKGDANTLIDEAIEISQVKGKYVKKVNFFKKIYLLLTNPLIIFISILGILLVNFLSIIFEIEKKR